MTKVIKLTQVTKRLQALIGEAVGLELRGCRSGDKRLHALVSYCMKGWEKDNVGKGHITTRGCRP